MSRLTHAALLTTLLSACAQPAAPGAPGAPAPGEPAPAAPAPQALRATIAPLPPEVLLGETITLDARGTSNGPFNVIWFVGEPEGCDRSAPAGAQDTVTTFTALCVGRHEVTLEVTPIGGGEFNRAELSFDVRVRDNLLDIAVASIEPARLGADAIIVLDYDREAIPEALTSGDEPLQVEADVEFRVDADGRTIRVPMTSVHATETLSFQLVVGDLSSEVVSATVTTLNAAPEVNQVSATAFNAGESLTITASATDDDGDEVTCGLAFADDSEGPEFELPAPSTTCVFSLTPPAVVANWVLQVSASDAFGGEDDDDNRIAFTPGNRAPVLEPIADVELGYACDAAACVSELASVNLVATDDIDDEAALNYELSVISTSISGQVSIEPDASAPGAFTVEVSRADVGGLAGELRLLARVTEVSTTGALAPQSATEELTVRIVNARPTVSDVVAEDVPHAFEGGLFVAEVEIAFATNDAEGNATGQVRVATCPGGAAPVDGACGALTFDAAEKSGDAATFELTSDELGALAGELELEVFAVDADGAESSRQRVVVVIENQAPIALASFNLSQSGSNGRHAVTHVAFRDPDGDPIVTNDVIVSCPVTPCVADIELRTDGAIRVESAPVAGFLGEYSISGTVSDGAASVDAAGGFTVINRAPTLSIDLAASTASRNHRTANGVVGVDPAERGFPLSITVDDADGDELVVIASAGVVLSEDTLSAGEHALEYDLIMSYAEFKTLFNGSGFASSFVVRDPFGFQSNLVKASPRYLNRTLSPSDISVELNVGNDGIDALRFTERVRSRINPLLTLTRQLEPNIRKVSGGRLTHVAVPACTDPLAPCTVSIPGSVTIDAIDPDGDPLEVRHSQSAATDLDTVNFQPLKRTTSFQLFPRNKSCAEGNLFFVPVGGFSSPFQGEFASLSTPRLRDVDDDREVSAFTARDEVHATSTAAETSCQLF